MKTTHNLALALFAASCSPFVDGSSLLPRGRKAVKGKFPFTQIVAFGDQNVDNGNGSYAHGLDPGNIYGYHTWTDGPVAVSYLNELLGVALQDMAWGGWFGGGMAGSTIDNTYTPGKSEYNGKPVPATADQINNFTSTTSAAVIKKSLPIIWVGQNDAKKHTNWYAADPDGINPNANINQAFYKDFTALLLAQVQQLIDAGAPAVVFMNIYPIQASPANTYFFCGDSPQCTKNWGTVISGANDYIKNALAATSYADQVIYYDVFGFLTKIMANKDKYGYTQPLTNYCDGNHSLPTCMWDTCTVDKWDSARPFFWFTNGALETTVHRYIALDLKKVITAFFS